MSWRRASKWRALASTGLPLLLGCSSLLSLDELEKVDCTADECGGTVADAGNTTRGGGASGSHDEAGSSANVSGAAGSDSNGSSGRGGSGHGGASGSANGGNGTAGKATGGNGAAGKSTAGTDSGGVATGGGGRGGSEAGGSAGGGAAGSSGVAGCTPSAADQSCDGLDQACQPTQADTACAATCKGYFLQGSSYMACVASDTFDQAEAACQANGMHLASVTSALESATVLSIAPDDYVWIGGSNVQDANVYVWRDGTAFLSSGAPVGSTYENFAPGQPAADAGLRCVQQDPDGAWSNWLCSEAQSFVCKH